MKAKTLLLFLLVIVIFSCKKDNVEPEDNNPDNGPYDAVIAEKAKVFNSTSRSEIISLDTSNFTFKFNQGSSFAAGLKQSDVLVDSASNMARYGFLRKVSSINTVDGNTVVQTEQATLEDIILQGSIDIHSVSLKSTDIDEIYMSEGFTLVKNLKNTDLLGFDMDFEHPIGGNQNAIITGSIYFNLEFNFELDISFTGVDYFKTSVELIEQASLGLDVTSDVSLTEDIVFAQITFTPWTIMVGIVPIVFVPKVELVMHSDLTITGIVKTYATQNYRCRRGLVFA